MELAKILLINKLQDVAFLNLLQIISKLLTNFTCYEIDIENFEKTKLINSSLIPMAEYLIIHLEEIIFLIKSFDHKLLSQIISFPINLYKIYIYYKDENNHQNLNKYEKYFHFYMKFLFQEIRNLLEPFILRKIVKTLFEYQI